MMTIEKLISQEKIKFQKGLDSVKAKRQDWENLENRIRTTFKKVVDEAKDKGFFDSLHIFSNNGSSLEKQTNQNFINLQMGKHPNGIVTHKNEVIENSVEEGGALVIAQGVSGEVYVTIYPCESEEIKIKSGYILLRRYSKPSKLTDKKILKAVRHFFWYCYISSFVGKMSFRDVLKIRWLKFKGNLNIFKISKLFSSAIKNAVSIGGEMSNLPRLK